MDLTLSNLVAPPVDRFFPVANRVNLVKVQAGGTRVLVGDTVGAVVKLVTCLE